MIIYEDTRQQIGKHDLKNEQIKSLGYTVERKWLKQGDYMLDGKPSVSVDTKYSTEELYLDLMGEHSRFRREIVSAYKDGVKLIVLIEEEQINKLSDLKRWTSARGKANGYVLYDKAMKLHYAYGVEFMFCKPAETGYKIVELLTNY